MQDTLKLRPHLETEFQRQLLDAAALSMNALDNLLGFNNISTTFRELVRHVFDNLALDEEKKCAWYKPEPTSRTGVTRAHRVGFVIHGGIAPALRVVSAMDTATLDFDITGKSRD